MNNTTNLEEQINQEFESLVNKCYSVTMNRTDNCTLVLHDMLIKLHKLLKGEEQGKLSINKLQLVSMLMDEFAEGLDTVLSVTELD